MMKNSTVSTRLTRLFPMLFCIVSLAGAAQLSAQATQNPQTSRMRGTTNAQRKAAAAKAAVRRATTMRSQKQGMRPNAAIGIPGGTAITDPAQLYFSGIYPNYANSPLPNPSDTVNCAAPNFCGIRKFVDTLPGLNAPNSLGQQIPVAVPDTTTFPGSDYYEIGVAEYSEKLHSDLPATKLRGYCQLVAGVCAPGQPQYLGPVIVAQENRAVRVKFVNLLPSGAGGNLFLPVDKTVMGSGLGLASGSAPYLENRATLHLHGGNTPWISDGTPHQWTVPAADFATTYPRGVSTQFVPDMFYLNGVVVPQCSATVTTLCSGGTPAQFPVGATNDPGPGAMTFYWTNQQSGRLMFYHDHAYGITRLNVYAGEAAGYLLQDPVEADLTNGTNSTGIFTAAGMAPAPILPAAQIPLVIQDKTFVPPNPASAPVYSIGLLAQGSGYTAPTVAITGGGCTTTPTATATFGDIIDPFGQFVFGAITGVTLTSGGAGCTSDPVVTISDATGTGAAAFASLAILSQQDPTWDTALWGGTGSLWYPHVYMTNQWPDNPDASNVNPMGRWDYGSWFFPPFANGTFQVRGPIACPLPTNPAAMCPGFPTVLNPAPAVDAVGAPNKGAGSIASLTPEAFMDTPLVNGTAYPTLTVQPQPYRLRILSAGNDRTLNLSLFLACDIAGQYTPSASAMPCPANSTGIAGTEVGMVPAVATAGFPAWWPTDGRDGGVPDPAAAGPKWNVIGTEGGFLPAVAVIPPAPNNYEYNRRSVTVLNVSSHSLMLMPAERADVIVDFSAYAGKTLILYNDGAAPIPAFDTRYDYYTDDPDQTGTGGAPTTLPGYGPNTRTVMQIKVAAGTPAPFNPAPLQTALPAAFKLAQPVPVVPEPALNKAYGGNFPAVYGRLQNNGVTFTPIGAAAPVTIQFGMKTIQELFELDYGRMNATLGTELPFTNFNTQTTVPLGYVDPPTENIYDSNGLSSALIGTAGDGTQIWQITHNGVDSHAIHFHLYNVQVLNRFGWDGTTRPPEPIEMGWKDTVRMNPLEIDYVALRPMSQSLPFAIPDSTRLLDVTMPVGFDPALSAVGPNGNAIPQQNVIAPLGWEYVWHCHILGHEENDMMRDQIFQVPPETPANLVAVGGTPTGAMLAFTDKSASETGFTLERADDAGFTLGVVDIGLPAQPGYGTVVNYTDAVAAGASYYFRVRAFKPDQSYFGLPLPNLASAWSNVLHYVPAPVASVNPTSLNFGSVVYGLTSAPQTVVLSNVGAATLNIASILIGGANPAAFIMGTNTCGATLAPAASCSITLTFTPPGVGPYAGSLLIASNDPVNATLTVPMTGTGTPAALTIMANPATMVHGAAALPAFTVTPTGLVGTDTLASLGFNQVCTTTATLTSPVGSYPIDCSTSTITAPNYTVTYVAGTLTITRAPASVTPNTATKVYGTADPALTGTLTGFLAADGITATYARTAGETVGTYTISATLSPAAALANYAITYNTAAFTITPLGASVTVNPATKVYGTADPVFSGTLTGFLVADNVTATYSRVAGENVGTYVISATLSPAGVLGNYTITNNPGLLTITRATSATTITAHVPNPSAVGQAVLISFSVTPQFTGTPTGNVTVTANSGESCTGALTGGAGSCALTFLSAGAKTITATYAGDVNFAGSASLATGHTVTSAAGIVVSPAALVFAPRLVGSNSPAQPVTVTNSGATTVAISSIVISGVNAGDFTRTTTCGANLFAGGSCTINVRFRPAAVGARSATLTVNNNSANPAPTVALSGTGLGAPVASFAPTSVTFAPQTRNTTSAPQTVTLTNTGGSPLVITNIRIAGGNATNFAITTNTCPIGGTGLAAGANCTVNVTFRPTRLGLRTSNLRLTDNAVPSPQNVPLSGTGQ